jgi:hypothetical protein
MNNLKLTINGKEIEFYFGLGFLGEALDGIDISISELGAKVSENPYLYVPKLMYYSASYGYKRKGQETPFSYFDLLDDIENDGGFSNDNLNTFLNKLTESMSMNVPKGEEVGSVTSKKK